MATRIPIFSCLLISLCAAFFLTACGNEPSSAPPPTLGSGNLRWASFPVPLEVEESLLDGADRQEDLQSAVAFWENKAGKTLFQIGSWKQGEQPFRGDASDPTDLLANVLFFQSPWPKGGDWGDKIAGKTILHSTGRSINHAVIFLNPFTSLCSGLCVNESGYTSRRKLIAHELGHFLGFAHVSDRSNIMNPEIQPGGNLDNEQVDMALLRRLTVSL